MIGLPFRVIEENEVDSVQVFVSGREGDGEVIDTVGENRHLYCWDSRSHPDGYYTFEVFARDQSGNVGRSPVLLTQVVNQALPRVLYVPDDEQTLQAAINAAREGDTIRVQPGIYNIGIMTWKRIIKKSESIATD